MFWSWRSVFWSWRVLVLIFVTCHVRSVTSELDPERWSSGWQFALWLTDSSLCAPGYWARSVRPPTLTPSSEEFWGNLCTVSWLIELATSCRQCVHCGCRTMLGFMVQTPPPPPHPTPNNAMTTMASLSCSSQRPASGSITGPSLTSWIGPDLGGQVTYRAGLIHGYYYSMLTNVKHDHRLQVNNTLKIYMYVLLLYMHVTFTLYSLFE